MFSLGKYIYHLRVYCMKFTLEMGANSEYTLKHNVQTSVEHDVMVLSSEYTLNHNGQHFC